MGYNNIFELLDIAKASPAGLNKKFQEQIVSLYQTHYKAKISENLPLHPNEDDIVTFITKLSEMHSKNIPAFSYYPPNQHILHDFPGLECTLSSAILKLTFIDFGFSNIRTLLLEGHQVTAKIEEKSITIFDPSTKITQNGEVHGFIHEFYDSSIIWENNNIVTLASDEQIPNTGMFELHNNKYTRKFYVLPDSIHVHIVTILRNLKEYFSAMGDKRLADESTSLIKQFGEDNPHLQLENIDSTLTY